jgi:hypothetical protein
MLQTLEKNKQQRRKWCFENEQEKELQQKIPKHPLNLIVFAKKKLIFVISK